MPGVADAERRTRNAQKQQGRKKDREELMRLLKEGRLHEADEHQVEQIKLALELKELLDAGTKEAAPAAIDTEALQAAMRGAVAEVIQAMPRGSGPTGSSISDPARPKMKHTSLTSIKHEDSGLDVQGADKLAEEKEGDENAADKLKRLRELKGSK
jgi:hypothetical protein